MSLTLFQAQRTPNDVTEYQIARVEEESQEEDDAEDKMVVAQKKSEEILLAAQREPEKNVLVSQWVTDKKRKAMQEEVEKKDTLDELIPKRRKYAMDEESNHKTIERSVCMDGIVDVDADEGKPDAKGSTSPACITCSTGDASFAEETGTKLRLPSSYARNPLSFALDVVPSGAPVSTEGTPSPLALQVGSTVDLCYFLVKQMPVPHQVDTQFVLCSECCQSDSYNLPSYGAFTKDTNSTRAFNKHVECNHPSFKDRICNLGGAAYNTSPATQKQRKEMRMQMQNLMRKLINAGQYIIAEPPSPPPVVATIAKQNILPTVVAKQTDNTQSLPSRAKEIDAQKNEKMEAYDVLLEKVEKQVTEEWRKQREALSHAEAEVVRVQADMSRLNATKDWLQQGRAQANKAEQVPHQIAPLSSPSPGDGLGAASSSSVSKEQLKEKLKLLKELHDEELIDEEDYKQQKMELMTFFRTAY